MIENLEKKKQTKKTKTYSNGLTLIALIITIIVLLILAGVSVATLTGKNGILTQVEKAKNETIKAEAKERIQLEALASIDNNGNYSKDKAKENLANNLGLTEDNGKVVDYNNGVLKVNYNGYEYEILEDGKVETPIDFATLESNYGDVVNGYTGYTAIDVIEWKLFYVDEQNREAFIISSNTLAAPQPTDSGIPLTSSEGVAYTGSTDVRNFEYGVKYNSLWLEKCTTESQNSNAKATAYLCDPSNWGKYVTGKAKYAAGGATLEMLVASFKNKQVKNLSTEVLEITSVTSIGYPQVIWSVPDLLYNTGYTYWLASPNTSRKYAMGGLKWYYK